MSNKLVSQAETQHRALKLRIYPTKEQEILINKTFGCCRQIYNNRLFGEVHAQAHQDRDGQREPVQNVSSGGRVPGADGRGHGQKPVKILWTFGGIRAIL